MITPFLFQIFSKSEYLFRNGLRKDPCQEKDSEKDSEMSSDNVYCLEVAHARRAVREPPGFPIVT